MNTKLFELAKEYAEAVQEYYFVELKTRDTAYYSDEAVAEYHNAREKAQDKRQEMLLCAELFAAANIKN